MLNKTMIAVAAGAAFAYEDPENKIGDRYPRLEQKYEPISGNRSAARQVTPRQATPIQVTAFNRPVYDAPENKISDRYPLLELRTVSQIAPILRGQRVWNTQPEGGLVALGISPSRRMRAVSV